jgi:sec-independent protein translocase protein TatB
MLDFGWPELFVIVALAVLLVGPQDLPRVMVALGRIVRRLQYARYAISQQFENIMREADLDDIRKSVNFEEASGSRELYEDAESDEEFATLGVGINDEEGKDHV